MMEETGPVGETPVHLAFLFGLGDLGKRCASFLSAIPFFGVYVHQCVSISLPLIIHIYRSFLY